MLLFVLTVAAAVGRRPGHRRFVWGRPILFKTVSHQEGQPRSPGSTCTSRHLDPTTPHITVQQHVLESDAIILQPTRIIDRHTEA